MKGLVFAVVIFLLFSWCSSVAQESSSEKTAEIPQLIRKKLLHTQNKQLLEKANVLVSSFDEQWNQINAGIFLNKENIAGIIALMESNGFKSYNHYFSLIENINQLSLEGQTFSSIQFWIEELHQIVNQKQQRTFDQFLKKTNELVFLNKIGGRGTSTWFLRDGNWSFEKDTSLHLVLFKGNLVCATSRDSLTLKNTTGKLDFNSSDFRGFGGMAGWDRFGKEYSNKYVELQSYQIDLTKPVIEADSVILFHSKYLRNPILGRFQDQVFNSPPSEQLQFPKFETYLTDLEILDLFPGMDFQGGLRFEGLKTIGVGNDAQLASIYIQSDKSKKASIRSKAFVFTNSRVQSDGASLAIHLENDSIYHAGLWMRYDHEKGLLNFNRSDRGIGDAPFLDSYHQVNIFVESVYWNIRTDIIEFRQMEGLGSTSTARIESSRLFSREVFARLLGMDERHPVFVIADYIKKFETNGVLQLGFLSNFMRKPEEQVVAQLLRLAALGFLSYDAATQTATVNERFFHIAEAQAGRTDFDVIAINSSTIGRAPNIILNLISNDLIINGVKEVVLSETQGVQLFPENQSIIMKRNRDFAFSGLVRAGLFDFHAREAVFEYDPFKLNFAFVDSLTFMVKERGQDPAKSFPDYVKVKNVLSDLNGTLYIDEPGNKSGRADLPRFPVFTSKSESYVYYDQPYIQQGTLQKEHFFYVVDPFEIDSLDNFSTDNLRFEGYLTSAGIFPVFREPLTVMKDYSLGFEHHVPADGYAMYGNLGHYQQTIGLSNQGFYGWGSLQYLSTTAYAKDFVFYPDSVIALADRVEIVEQLVVPEFPRGVGENVFLNWDVKSSDLMLTTREQGFSLYDNNSFEGMLTIQPQGMTGWGKLAFDQAQVQSLWFDFLAEAFGADTADFRLFSLQGNKEAFLANDYRTFVNYRDRQASFIHLGVSSKLSFPYNQYYCTLDEAVWMMDEQKIKLNNNKVENQFDFDKLTLAEIIDLDLKGSEFVSEHHAQDSLSFFCLLADYDLDNYAIVAQDVKILRVADAAVFPNDGVITIMGDAQMKPLESATIIANVQSKIHHIYDAKVSIISSKQFNASGSYTYTDLNGQDFILKMPEISVSKSGNTIARVNIQPEDEFFLNPWFAFAGDAYLDASSPFLQFKGGFRLQHNCAEQALPWVSFDTVIDPLNVKIPINQQTFDIHGGRISNGLYYATVNDSYYAAFLQTPKGADRVAAFVSGNLVFDRESASYKIIDSEKSTKQIALTLNTNRCIVEGKAPIDLDLKLGQVQIETVGSFLYKMIPDSLFLDVFVKLNFPFDDKLLKQMADSLTATNLPGAPLNTGNYLSAIRSISGTDEAERIGGEIALYGSPRRIPEYLQRSIIFSDLKLKWNATTRSFVSTEPFGLANILDKNTSKLTNGYVEIEKSRAGDGISVYLMLNAKQWFFFSYKSGVMQALSSSNQFNTDLMKIKQDKRVLNDPATGGRYEYIIATRRRMVDFLRKMQETAF